MSTFNMMKVFLAMGDIVDKDSTLEQKLAYKERIVFSTMKASIPDWEVPEHYKSLSVEDKLELLEKIQQI